jgi:biotin synthase
LARALEEAIRQLEKKVLGGVPISREDALSIAEVPGTDIFGLFASANRIRQHFRDNTVGLCSIINAKSGACPEDCSFCAQSSKNTAAAKIYPLVKKEIVIEKAKAAAKSGVSRFSVVTSGRKISRGELSEIAGLISAIRETGLLPCASLGLLNAEELSILKEAGLERYHHNLETSERFFPKICSTHTFADKIETVRSVRVAGLSLCSGGIFGMGETWQDRIDVAFSLKESGADSVPINFLIPIKGTALGHREYLHPFEALKIISLFRFVLPGREIRVCGGRTQVLGEFHSMVFLAGADGMITGDYLTTIGRNPEDDIRLIETYGLSIL